MCELLRIENNGPAQHKLRDASGAARVRGLKSCWQQAGRVRLSCWSTPGAWANDGPAQQLVVSHQPPRELSPRQAHRSLAPHLSHRFSRPHIAGRAAPELASLQTPARPDQAAALHAPPPPPPRTDGGARLGVGVGSCRATRTARAAIQAPRHDPSRPDHSRDSAPTCGPHSGWGA